MLILVRHGRTAANAGGKMQGAIDNPLDATGLKQAARIGDVLGDVARVVASPARRAVATAEAIGTPEVDARWAELDFGVYDGRPISEVPADAWSRWRSDEHWAPEGGESVAAMRERVFAACADVMADAVDNDVVVVSHVSPIKAAVSWALGSGNETAWRSHLDVASISRIAIRRGEPMLVSFNEIQHLDGAKHTVVRR